MVPKGVEYLHYNQNELFLYASISLGVYDFVEVVLSHVLCINTIQKVQPRTMGSTPSIIYPHNVHILSMMCSVKELSQAI